ncbi:hypothetical protein AB5J62_36700 [Amycolatopsis sp. cg5]|uniref:hypothetical protein n=1 Tax=Amycolatopsis sp. cg5 TaxID=3238802 RepID=UPI00352635CA
MRERPAVKVLSPLTVAAFVAGVVPFAFHAWAALHGSLGQDDFLITYRAGHAGPFDLGYLFQDYQGHLAPGCFLLTWFLTALAPLNFAVLTIPLLLMQAAASVFFWALLVRCFGRRWAILVPFTVVSASNLLLVPTVWWAYGIQVLPVLLAMTGALHAHVRYLRDGGRWAIGTVAWTVFGLSFYEKGVFVAVLVVGITVLLGEPLREYLKLWACLGAVLVGYVVLSLSLTSSQVAHGSGTVSAGTVADLSGRMLADTLLPGLLGGPWSGPGPGATWSPSPILVSVGLLIGLLVLVIVTGRRTGRRAWQAWILLGFTFAVDVALVAATRLTDVGPGLGNDPRYVAELALVAALCGSFALLTPGETGGARERPVAIVLCVLLLASSAVTFPRLAPALRFDQSRQYIANVRAAVESDSELVLYDTFVPRDVMHEWFADNSRASHVVGLIPGTRFDQAAVKMHLLDDLGRPKRITGVDPIARGLPGPVPDCGTVVGEELVRVPLDKPVLGRNLLKIEYFTSDGGEGFVDHDGVRTPVWFPPGVHAVYVPIEGLYDKVGLQLSGKGAPICAAKLEIGKPITQ